MTHPNPLTLTTTDIHTLRTALDTLAPNDTALLRQQLAGALAERDLYRLADVAFWQMPDDDLDALRRIQEPSG